MRRKHTPTVFDVVNYFLSCVDEGAGSIMTHLKLQKLCYYAQAWNLAFNNDPLFKERFQAWVHGPVCPTLWYKYKDLNWFPIPALTNFNSDVFTKEQLETLETVWDAYGQFDAKYLEELTHQEEPWLNARNGYDPGGNCDVQIDLNDMKLYYTKLLEE